MERAGRSLSKEDVGEEVGIGEPFVYNNIRFSTDVVLSWVLQGQEEGATHCCSDGKGLLNLSE